MTKPMVYLGDTGKLSFQKTMDELGWGIVTVDVITSSIRKRPFILDNGAFISWRNDQEWNEDRFLGTVDKVYKSGKKPDFVILPDKVGGGVASLALSHSWIERLPKEWPKALASQDGLTNQELISAMSHEDISVWFLGGTDAHKLHAKDYCEAAHRIGKKFHFARCSTLEKLDWAMEIRVDSLDSSFPLWTKERFYQFVDVWKNGHPQYKMEGIWKSR